MFLPLSTVSASPVHLPSEKRALGRRQSYGISAGMETRLRFGKTQKGSGDGARPGGVLRLTAAVDHRVNHRICVRLGTSREQLGELELLCASAGSVYEIPLAGVTVAELFDQGVILEVSQAVEPFFFVCGDAPAAILPHVFLPDEAAGDPEEAFLDLFCSLASLQPCDWMGMCVWDGLNDWAALGHAQAEEALSQQLDVFFPDSGDFLHEDIYSHPLDNQANSAENHGPVAVLVQHRLQHPAIAITGKGLLSEWNDEVKAVCGNSLVAETAYSVAYPMMAMVRFCGWESWQQPALQQLDALQKYLVVGDELWLRYFFSSDERTFKNWSRGVTWYFLGMVRTLALMPAVERPASLLLEVQRMATWAEKSQRGDGSWSCFIGEEGVLPDSSGTAGIAAALALAVKEGMLSVDALDCALKARAYLKTQLSADGWLRGVAVSNKKETADLDIQRIPYRVIGPWGMGLYAQLLAALAFLQAKSP
ncbi:glycoside hydrolase family 88 protein [Kiritimatiellota bacterium B12222]|nr:glycoside hydrolase family 88 protein [Kiritimatiellota bacterium B12222]